MRHARAGVPRPRGDPRAGRGRRASARRTVALDGDTIKLVEKELKADGTETGNSVTVVIAAAGAGCDFTITNQAGISFVEKMVRA